MQIARATKSGIVWWLVSLLSALALLVFAFTRVAVGV